jgi:hypothetical protein
MKQEGSNDNPLLRIRQVTILYIIWDTGYSGGTIHCFPQSIQITARTLTQIKP